MRKLNLDDLKAGQPGLSLRMAEVMVEAAIICLILNGHQSGVILKVEGDKEETFQLLWTDEIDQQIINTWKDQKEAVEYGASAIGILLLFAYEKLIIRERLPQDGNADYSLRTTNTDQFKGQLEVSGIWQQSITNHPKGRVKIKIEKLERKLPNGNFPVFVIVTEFSIPKSKIKKYGK